MNKSDQDDITAINAALASLPFPQPELEPHEYALAVTDYRINNHRETAPFGGLLVTFATALIAFVALLNSLPRSSGGAWTLVLVVMLGVVFLATLVGNYAYMLLSSRQAARITVHAVLMRRRQDPGSSR